MLARKNEAISCFEKGDILHKRDTNLLSCNHETMIFKVYKIDFLY